MFTGNNGYIAQMATFALAGSSGVTTYMSASGNMNVVIGSPLNLSATAVYSQQQTPGTGFDTVNFNGTTSGTSNGGLGNVIYGTIADSPGFIQNGGWPGETNVQFNAIYSGQQGSGAASGGSTSLWTVVGNQTYHGWTDVNGGTLQLGTGQPGQNGNLYSQGLLLNSGHNYYGNAVIVWGGALIFNNYDNQTVSFRFAATETNTPTSPLTKLGAGDLILTGTANGFTQLTISAGTFQIGAGATAGTISTSTPITNNSFLVFDRSDTVAYPDTINGNGTLVQIGNGTLNLSGSISGGQSIRENAGTMTLSGINAFNGTTTVTGGTLNVSTAANSTSAISVTGGQLNLNASANGASTISVAGGLANLSASVNGASVMSVGSGGTLNLNASANAVTAMSVAAGGKLNLNGATNAATTISVSGTLTSSTSASIGNAAVAVANGGVLSPGFGPAGSLTMSSLSFTSGGTVNVTNLANYLSLPAISSTSNNSLTDNGATGAVTFNLIGRAPALLNANYEVLGYSAAIQGTGSSGFAVSTLGITGSPNGASFTLGSGPGFVGVNYSVSGNPIWTGGADGTTWDTTQGNWKNTSGTTTFKSNDLAYFDDTGAPNTTVTINSAVTPYSAYFANNSAAYTLMGTSGIAGSAMPAMAGSGSLTVTNTNTYTGGTFLYNGTLNVGTSAALGGAASTLTLAGGTLNNSTAGVLTLPNYPMQWLGSFGFGGSSPLNLGTGNVAMPVPVTVTLAGHD